MSRKHGVLVLLAVCILTPIVIAQDNQLISPDTVPVEPDELSEHFKRMTTYHGRVDGNVPEGAVLFIGDSITQGLCVVAVCDKGVNYGIGSDTTAGVLHRLHLYGSLERTAAVVLAIGVNDLRRRDNAAIMGNITRIRDYICPKTPLLISAMLPLDERVESVSPDINARIKALNTEMAKLCEGRTDCLFADAGDRLRDETGNLSKEYHVGDGVHPNTAGYEHWIQTLKIGLEQISHRPVAQVNAR